MVAGRPIVRKVSVPLASHPFLGLCPAGRNFALFALALSFLFAVKRPRNLYVLLGEGWISLRGRRSPCRITCIGSAPTDKG